MVLLDTNVLSEQFQANPNKGVLAWLNEQALETLYLSVMTVAEIRAGVALMPQGKRKRLLGENIEENLLPLFAGRVLPFDVSCTRAYAKVLAAAKKAGSGIAAADAVIAATALDGGFMVATRDTSPFEASGLKVINPWETIF